MCDMPRTTGRNKTRLPKTEATKGWLKMIREFLPLPGRKLRIQLGQIQEDVIVMLFKIPGLLRSPDQVGVTEDRSHVGRRSADCRMS